MSIGPYTISPFINNRQLNTACGLGNHDTQNTFLVSAYTSGPPSEIGLCVQGAGGAALDSGAPIDITQLWIDFLKSSVNFTIDTPQLTITNNLEMTGSIITEDPSIERKVTIQPASIEVRDTQNDPFGDPINVVIYPNIIQLQGDDGNHRTSNFTALSLNIHDDEGVGDDLNLSASALTISDSVASTIMTINANSITATNWNINSDGEGHFGSDIFVPGITTTDNITIGSMDLLTPIIQSSVDVEIDLGEYAIGQSFSITMNDNIDTLDVYNGKNGGVYKIWLTVGATPRTFTKACGVINDLLGDTLMAASSVWLITIYKHYSELFRATFDNFT